MRYLLDANVFIQAYNSYYGMDFCPAFWGWILHKAKEGVIGSIIPVYAELMRKEDEISEWSKKLKSNVFKDDHGEAIEQYKEIAQWAVSSDYDQSGKNKFLSGADPWLVAYAKKNECILVTQEKFDSNIKKRIPLPNCCRQFKVQYIDTFHLLRSEGAEFILGAA